MKASPTTKAGIVTPLVVVVVDAVPKEEKQSHDIFTECAGLAATHCNNQDTTAFPSLQCRCPITIFHLRGKDHIALCCLV